LEKYYSTRYKNQWTIASKNSAGYIVYLKMWKIETRSEFIQLNDLLIKYEATVLDYSFFNNIIIFNTEELADKAIIEVIEPWEIMQKLVGFTEV